jgi:hypothetical protein
MKHSASHIKRIHKIGALITLVGFSLGISFAVLMAIFAFLGEPVVIIAMDLIAIPIMGLLAFLIGMRLKSYRFPEALNRPLLEDPEEYETDLNDWREKRKERIKSMREDDLEV